MKIVQERMLCESFEYANQHFDSFGGPTDHVKVV